MSNWLDSLITPSGFLFVVSHLFAILVFMGKVGKKEELKLGCKKYFCKIPY